MDVKYHERFLSNICDRRNCKVIQLVHCAFYHHGFFINNDAECREGNVDSPSIVNDTF